MFNHSLALLTDQIFCCIILRNHWTWKISDCLTGLRLILWFIGVLELDLKSTQTILLDLDWFCVFLDLCLKNTRTNLMHSDFIIANQGCCWKILKTYLNNLLGCSAKYEKNMLYKTCQSTKFIPYTKFHRALWLKLCNVLMWTTTTYLLCSFFTNLNLSWKKIFP